MTDQHDEQFDGLGPVFAGVVVVIVLLSVVMGVIVGVSWATMKVLLG